MAVDQRDDHEGGKPDREQPGEGEVPDARVGKAVARGDRRPMRKGAALRLPRLVAPHAEHAGRRDFERAQPGEAALAARADLEPGGVGVGAIFPPVEPRMGVEDHQPAHQHDDQRDGIDPMPQPRRQRVARHEVAADGFSSRRRRRSVGRNVHRVTLGHAPLVARSRPGASRRGGSVGGSRRALALGPAGQVDGAAAVAAVGPERDLRRQRDRERVAAGHEARLPRADAQPRSHAHRSR